jgi:hypothetical protein
MRTISGSNSRFACRAIDLSTFRSHNRRDCKWIARQGYTIERVTAVFDGLVSGPFLGYVVKTKSCYLGVSTSRANRYTQLSHKSARAVVDWLKTGKEV